MSIEYRIEPVGNQFIVIDPWGKNLVDSFLTEEEAQHAIEECKKEDAMWETTELLVDPAIKAHMQMHDVDREIGAYWINSALGGS